ncbi:MAG: hypothetical protein HVN35_08765 [Methanobacteriaceae archaeon]|nr:hypothetical protein [Methanobacteriaceae archaeon]
MEFRNILSLMFKSPAKLKNEQERRIQFLSSSIFLFIFFYVLSYLFVGVLMKLDYFPFFLSLYFTSILANYIGTYYWKVLDEKYSMLPTKSTFSYSYQGYVMIFVLFSPMFFFVMLSLGLTSDNFFFGLGGAVALVYPILGMFIRIKTFNDDSIIIPTGKAVLPDKVVLPDGKELSSGKKEVTETVRGFGFMPISYWILASAVGLYTVGRGFSGIQLHFTNGTPSLEAAIFSIFLGLLLQTLYLFPDKLNKVVPIELRTKKGFLFMFILAFVLVGVSQFLIGIVTILTS